MNWSPAPDYAAHVISHDLPGALDAWRGSGVVFAETEHFELVSIPQSAPDGLLATVLAVRAKNPTDRIVTLRQLSFSGDLHQVGVQFPTGILTTPIIDDFFRPVPLPDDWRPADSHELLGIYDVGAMYIGPAATDEDNDLTNPVGLDAQLSSFSFGPAVTGIGDIRGTIPEHAFSLDTLLQVREVALGQLVTPAIMPDTGQRGEVLVRVGILGADESNEPLPDEGVVGLDEPVRIPFFSEPCDFNADGRCDIVDVDLLQAALDTSNTLFDLQEDGTIDLNDRDQWLELAGNETLGEPFVLGDTDLNGTVDATDLNRIGLNWLSNDDSLLWSGGDFNGDHVVNAADLNELGLNWLHGEAAEPVRTVPEPGAWTVFLIVFFITERRWRKQRWERNGAYDCSLERNGKTCANSYYHGSSNVAKC